MTISCAIFALTLPAHAQLSDKNINEKNAAISERQHVLQREQWFAQGRKVPGENAALLRLQAQRRTFQMKAERLAAASGIAEFLPNAATSPGATWTPLGPSSLASDASGTGVEDYGAVSGRATSIAVDPADSGGNTVYIGGAYGGVWKAPNAATPDPSQVRWTSLTDGLHNALSTGCPGGSAAPPFPPTLAIGALAIQPGNTDVTKSVVLAGTGEPDNSSDSYYGVGILRFTNGGSTWCLISQAATGQSFAGLGFSKIAFSTINPNLVVVAAAATSQGLIEGLEDPTTLSRGIYYSADAGQTWNYATIQDGSTIIAPKSVTSVVYNAVAKEFFAAVRNHGFYVSSDGSVWSRLPVQPGVGLTAVNCPATPTSVGCPLYRAELAIVPGRNEMYAWFMSLDSLGDEVDEGIWETSNGGSNWNALDNTGIANCGDLLGCGMGNGAYNLALSAVPDGTTATDLYAGTVNLYKCRITTLQQGTLSCGGSENQFLNLTHVFGCPPDLASIAHVHPYQHAIAFFLPPGGNSLLYFANDGGIYRALDGFNGLTSGTCGDTNQFDDLNQTLGSMTQFVSFSQHPTGLNTLLGGAQGNGSPATSTAESSTAWLNVNSGDGGFTAINPANPLEWFTENIDVSIQRCTKGIACHTSDFVPVVEPATVGGDHSAFYTPYILDPQTTSSQLIVGTCRVWRGAGSGGTFTALSDSFETGAGGCTGTEVNMVRSLAAGGPPDQNGFSNVIYAGTNGDGPLQTSGAPSGHIWVTTNANGGPSTWIDVTNGINPDEYPVASIALDSSDTTGHTAYAAIMGFHTTHVWKTTTAGTSWTDFTGSGGSALPDSPANALAVDAQGSTLYVGTDVGVFSTPLASPSWTEVGPASGAGLLPNVAVTALRIYTYAGVKRLRASTYGRGIWEISLLSGPDFALSSSAPSQTVFPGQSATFAGTASAFNGYSSPVTLACIAGGTPPPQTCTVNPTSITPTGSGANFTVTASDVIGDYSFNIHGSGGDAQATTHDAPLSLHVVDFAITAPTPSSISVPRGTTSQVVSLLATGLGSFSGSVGFACSGLPTGATCSFAPSSAVNPTATVPVTIGLTVNVPSSAPIAISTVTISAASSGAPAAKTQTFTLSVVANPDFVLTANSAFPNVKSEGSASGTINVAAQDGFTGVVSLSCLVIGGNGSCTASPNTLNAYPANPTISLNATGIAGGSAFFAITGTSSTATHTLTVPFNVSDFQLAATAASAPAGQTATSTVTITPVNSYTGTVSLACDTTSVPGASCSFNPASPISLGAGPVQVTASISIPASSSNNTYSIPLSAKDTSGTPQHTTTIPLTVGADFQIIALTPSPQSLTVQAGQPAQFAFNVQPVNGTFNGSILFSCTGAPQSSLCSFSPTATTPPLSATDTVLMNVTTTAPTAFLKRPFGHSSFTNAIMLPLAGFLFCCNPGWDAARKRRGKKKSPPSVIGLLLLLMGLVSCGGGLVGNKSVTARPGTPSGTYNITVTASSGSLSHPSQVTLIVQ
ncbi:MAG TPA: hypothetical protein VGG46_16010 [Terriglobales bacterium]